MSDQWDGERVARWLRQAEGLERQLAPVSGLLFDAARLQPGEAVLDVGCGTGPTTWAAARAVGAAGRVVGLDVSAEMLAAAAAAAGTAESGGSGDAVVEWVRAHAVTWVPPAGAFDVVLSRFGVMFFSDPFAAFGHLADATRPGGRLAFAAWQRRDESDLFAVALHAAVATLPHLAAAVPPDDEGPFSLARTDALSALLQDAGWSDVAVAPHRLAMPFAGGVDRTAAAHAALDFGATRSLLADRPADEVAAAEAAIADAFADHLDEHGHVVLTGAVHVVTARRATVVRP
jgi:SAM-dependent methyltransferase